MSESVCTPVLRVDSVSRDFGSTHALRGVSFSLYSGEILGLVGANGAGKSTITKIISGALAPTSGSLFVDDVPVRLGSMRAASENGIEAVVQSASDALFSDLSVAQNLVFEQLVHGDLGAFPSRKKILEAASAIATAHFDLGISVETRVCDLSVAQRQVVLIAKALATNPKILILDEPTASLGVEEQQSLHGLIRELAAQGTAIIFISHHLAEVAQLCDRIVAFRDGEVVDDFKAPFSQEDVAKVILGDIAVPQNQDTERVTDPTAPVAFRAQGVSAFPGSSACDFEVHEGEVLGITGLVGAGKTEILSQLVGAEPLHAQASLTWKGKRFSPKTPADSIGAGIGYVPENRDTQAEIASWSVARNISLPDLVRYRNRAGFLEPKKEIAAAATVIEKLHIVAPGPQASIDSLSGGNRQKVVVGRWLAAGADLFILDEPFRGIDIGARADIARTIRQAGTAIVAASDPEEILEVADRILVIADGVIAGEVSPATTTSDELATLMSQGSVAASETEPQPELANAHNPASNPAPALTTNEQHQGVLR